SLTRWRGSASFRNAPADRQPFPSVGSPSLISRSLPSGQLQCRSGINAEISRDTCQVSTSGLSLTRSVPPRSRPPPHPHTQAAAVLINELNARDFDRSSNLFCGVFAPTQFAIH